MWRYSIASDSNIRELKDLWRKCFTDDELYLERFFSDAFPLTKTFILSDSDRITSSLSVFYIEYKSKDHSLVPGGYLYGVCTDPQYRGNNLSSLLLDYAKKSLIGEKLHFLITKPATLSLFELYKKQGFSHTLYLNSITCSISDISPSPVQTKALSIEKLNTLREVHYTRENISFIRWSNRTLEYIIKDIIYRGGSLFRIDDEYCICYPEYDNKNRITIIEHSFKDPDREKLFAHIKSIYPSSTSLNLLLPAISDQGRIESFLAQSLSESDYANLLVKENCYFNFPME